MNRPRRQAATGASYSCFFLGKNDTGSEKDEMSSDTKSSSSEDEKDIGNSSRPTSASPLVKSSIMDCMADKIAGFGIDRERESLTSKQAISGNPRSSHEDHKYGSISFFFSQGATS